MVYITSALHSSTFLLQEKPIHIQIDEELEVPELDKILVHMVVIA